MPPLQTLPWLSPEPGMPGFSPPDAINHLHGDIFSNSPSPPRFPTPPPSASHPRPLASTTTLSEVNPDLSKLRRVHQNEGYLAGISESKSAFIQVGFDSGYELGGRLGLVAGWVRGVAEGLVYAVSARGSCLGRDGAGAGVGVTDESGEMGDGDDGEGAQGGGGRGVGLIREVRALARDVEREVVAEKIFGSEYFLESGIPRWRVGRWTAAAGEGVEVEEGGEVGKEEQEEEEDGQLEEAEEVEHPGLDLDLDLDLVAQSHPVLHKWVSRVTLLARKLGLDVISTNDHPPAPARTSPSRGGWPAGEGETAASGNPASAPAPASAFPSPSSARRS